MPYGSVARGSWLLDATKLTNFELSPTVNKLTLATFIACGYRLRCNFNFVVTMLYFQRFFGCIKSLFTYSVFPQNVLCISSRSFCIHKYLCNVNKIALYNNSKSQSFFHALHFQNSLFCTSVAVRKLTSSKRYQIKQTSVFITQSANITCKRLQ